MFRLNYCRNDKYGIFREQNKNDIWKSEWVDSEAEMKLREKNTLLQATSPKRCSLIV